MVKNKWAIHLTLIKYKLMYFIISKSNKNGNIAKAQAEYMPLINVLPNIS